MNVKENDLMLYACEKFQERKYDEALEAFVLLYSKGYEREWIKENVYQCYVDGNENEFQKTFHQYIHGSSVSYEECILDFVPYREGEYYIFDKEIQEFIGIFSVSDLKTTKPSELLKRKEFGAASLIMDWDWRKWFSVLVETDKRALYVVAYDMARCISFFKVPELADYLKNVRIFSSVEEMQCYFHENIAEYLPQICYGTLEEQELLCKMVEEEHQYRLTPEGRSTDNVLLTIAIPTFHRGNLLLKRIEHLCHCQYDAEIEVVISKNGNGVYEEEYAKAAQMGDARFNYHDHGKELRYVVNWHYAAEMAHGKYFLLVSDEDDVVLDALDHYLALLEKYPEVSLLSAKCAFQGSTIVERQYGKKGFEAFSISFLKQNYVSGLIMRRKDFIDSDLLKLEKYIDNAFYQNYPHEWWCVNLCLRGDYLCEPVVLIVEQDYLGEPNSDGERDSEQELFLPVYATYEARLQQLKGEIEFLKMYMLGDEDFLEQGMARVMGKIDYLFGIARYRKYDLEHYESRISEYGEICMQAIQQFPLDMERKKKLLLYLKDCCVELFNEHVMLLEKEKEEESK